MDELEIEGNNGMAAAAKKKKRVFQRQAFVSFSIECPRACSCWPWA